MSRSANLSVNGTSLCADASGALWWPERRTLVVADLHLEKGSAFAANGQLLPPYDTKATLSALAEVISRYDPSHVICLGDSFHDTEAGSRFAASDTQMVKDLTGVRRWTWIIGNHDPSPPRDWGGEIAEAITLGALTFRHEAEPGSKAGEISGHYHPKAMVRLRVKRVSGRCFVTDGRRLILPAFGAYAGGLDVLDPAIAQHFAKEFVVQLLARDRVWPFPRTALLPIA